MRILLLGDFSNVHSTLAEGLRSLGHTVCVASDGDSWKNYPRDVDLRRPSLSTLSSLSYFARLLQRFRSFRNYDVVQLVNPVFLPLKAELHRPFYRYLRRHNGKIFLAAFGMDHYWVKAGVEKRFRYGDFNVGENDRDFPEREVFVNDWLHGAKGKLNQYIADDCDGIVAGLYEYYAAYAPFHDTKLIFIPFPIKVDAAGFRLRGTKTPLRFFIGIQQKRSEYKGTNIMLRALERLKRRYPGRVEVQRAENLPFNRYVRLFSQNDVLLDQLYSFTPAMNALEAMAKGMIVVGGGEEENYTLLGENKLRPIVNVLPDEDDVFAKLCRMVEQRDNLPRLSQQSFDYVAQHHDHLRIAQRYLDFWNSRG